MNATLVQALGLQLRGHAVEVWTASRPLAASLEALGIPVLLHSAIHSPIMLNCSQAVRARGRKLRKAGVDAVLHQGARSYVWSRIHMRWVPHAVIFHNRKLGGRRRFDHWFVLSHAHAADLAADQDASKGKTIHVIRNGYLPSGTPVAMSQGRQPQREHSPYRIGTLGGLVRRKGIDLLLKAVAESIVSGVPVELWVGGDGPEEKALKDLAEDLGISGSIRWLGWIDDRVSFYKAIDIFCLASRSEPFGLVLIEAMATGTPVIASKTDGATDILSDSSTGWLFPVDDHEALRDIIYLTFNDPANRVQVGQRGMTDAERRFSAEAAAETVETAVLKMLASGQNSGSSSRKPSHDLI